MGSSYTIVAIPRKDDYVWRISSEKIPHVTLLQLDDQQDKLVEITNYVQHVVDTCLCKFGLSVESRGTLGPKEADVLLFDDDSTEQLEQVRSYMLEDTNILLAYQNVVQFDEWTPHLTLGYPATPAKPDPRDYPGIDWINFDKIALWTGDYEGVEFPLKSQDDDLVRMTDAGAEFLAHFGVKGMHWGVHRQSSSRSTGTGGSTTHLNRALKKAIEKKKHHDAQYKVYADALKEHNKNGVHSQAMLDTYGGHVNHPVYFQQKYGKSLREAHAMLADQLETTAGHHALRSDKLQKKIDHIKARQNNMNHDDLANELDDFLQHFETSVQVDDFLAHFGVKGMHWGVRRDHPALGTIKENLPTAKLAKADPTKKAYSKATKSSGGLHKLSDADLRKMIERMDMERKYTKAMNEERDRRIAGLKAVGRILENVGKVVLPIVVASAAGAAAGRASGVYRTTATTGRVLEGVHAIGA